MTATIIGHLSLLGVRELERRLVSGDLSQAGDLPVGSGGDDGEARRVRCSECGAGGVEVVLRFCAVWPNGVRPTRRDTREVEWLVFAHPLSPDEFLRFTRQDEVRPADKS